MSTINDGGPAFPQVRDEGMNEWPGAFGLGGMSLRDYFAGQALTGLLAFPNSHLDTTIPTFCDNAYAYADAMLAARERGAQ